MIKKIYNLLPMKFQTKTRLAWLQEFDEEVRTFYYRLENPKPADYKLLAEFWGLPIEELMIDVELKTVKKRTKRKDDVNYMMSVVNHLSTPVQTEIPL